MTISRPNAGARLAGALRPELLLGYAWRIALRRGRDRRIIVPQRGDSPRGRFPPANAPVMCPVTGALPRHRRARGWVLAIRPGAGSLAAPPPPPSPPPPTLSPSH